MKKTALNIAICATLFGCSVPCRVDHAPDDQLEGDKCIAKTSDQSIIYQEFFGGVTHGMSPGGDLLFFKNFFVGSKPHRLGYIVGFFLLCSIFWVFGNRSCSRCRKNEHYDDYGPNNAIRKD